MERSRGAESWSRPYHAGDLDDLLSRGPDLPNLDNSELLEALVGRSQCLIAELASFLPPGSTRPRGPLRWRLGADPVEGMSSAATSSTATHSVETVKRMPFLGLENEGCGRMVVSRRSMQVDTWWLRT